MKKFLVFAGDNYYPNGGMGDCKGAYETFDEAKARLREIQIRAYYLGAEPTDDQKANDWEGRWGHIYDTETEQHWDGKYLTL